MIPDQSIHVKNVLGYICRTEGGRDPSSHKGIAADQQAFVARNFGLVGLGVNLGAADAELVCQGGGCSSVGNVELAENSRDVHAGGLVADE
jgi:hypothetical protein